MSQRITTSLQETVREHEHIGNVFFDAKGNHYFQAHKLPTVTADLDKEDKYKVFGAGVHSGTRVIPGPNEDKKREAVSVGKPGTEIVETISRADLLSAQAVPDDRSVMAQLLSDPNAKVELGKQLLSDPDFLAAIKTAFAPVSPAEKTSKRDKADEAK